VAVGVGVGHGQSASPDPIKATQPVWDVWNADLTQAEWSATRRKQARRWLDTVVIGGIATQ